MTSLTTSIKKAGASLPEPDKIAILDASRRGRADGLSASDAARAAVQAQIDAAVVTLADRRTADERLVSHAQFAAAAMREAQSAALLDTVRTEDDMQVVAMDSALSGVVLDSAALDKADQTMLQKSNADKVDTRGPVSVFSEGDKIISLDDNKDYTVTGQRGYKVSVKGRSEPFHANRLKLASGKKPTMVLMDGVEDLPALRARLLTATSTSERLALALAIKAARTAPPVADSTSAAEIEAYYTKYLIQTEERAVKFGRPKIEEETRARLASMVLSRDFGESIEDMLKRNPLLAAKRRAYQDWLAGNRPEAPTSPPAPAENDSTRLNALAKLAPKDREAITSDDPRLIEKLTAKLNYLTAFGDFMRKANKLFLKVDNAGMLAMGMTEAQIASMSKPDFAGRTGFPDYMMSNNNATLSAARKRLEKAMQAAQSKPRPRPEPARVPDGALTYDPATNRYNGRALKPGDLLRDTDGTRYRVDRANGFMVSADALNDEGTPSGRTSSFSVDPYDRDRWTPMWRVDAAPQEVPIGLDTIRLLAEPLGIAVDSQLATPGGAVEYAGLKLGAAKGTLEWMKDAGQYELRGRTDDGASWKTGGNGMSKMLGEFAAWAKTVQPALPPSPAGRFRYALVNRPAGLGAIPKVPYAVEPRPPAGQPHHDMARHGILVTERELTAQEVKAFELAPLVDGDDLAALADKVAESMTEYAAGHLEMAAKEPRYMLSQVMQTVERSSSGIRYSIGDPALLVQMVVDKLKAMVPAKPEPTPPPPSGGGQQTADDMAFLRTVANGQHPNMLEPELADEIEAALGRHADDKAIQDLGERAIVAYSNGLMAATGG